MGAVRVRVRGAASKYEIWGRFRDLERWGEWIPVRVRVLGGTSLRGGLEGELMGPFGARAAFDVIEVNEDRMRWTWVVRLGPLRVRVEHEADEGYAAAAIFGSAPAVAAYAPFARVALRRAVRRGGVSRRR